MKEKPSTDLVQNPIPTMAECQKEGRKIDYLLWVGCAGSFDDRYQRVMHAFCKLLRHANVSYAILGKEETCSGDPAKRAGNEFLFQMQAAANIEMLSSYQVKRIVTACPHCLNTLKHEYPALGGRYEVMHHSTLLAQLLREGRLRVRPTEAEVVYHDPCYLGRGQGVYEAPREMLKALFGDLREMRHTKKTSRCCGAGGAQIFKESEPSQTEIHHLRSQEALETGAKTLAVSCPFCMLMLSDGLKHHGKEEEVVVQDVAELMAAQLPEEAEKKTKAHTDASAS